MKRIIVLLVLACVVIGCEADTGRAIQRAGQSYPERDGGFVSKELKIIGLVYRNYDPVVPDFEIVAP